MDKVFNCPFCGGSVVTKSNFIEGLFLCENLGCHHIFMIYDVSAAEKEALENEKTKKKRKTGLPKDWRGRILK